MEDQPDRPETETPELIQLRNKVGHLEREAVGKNARIKQNEIDIENLKALLAQHVAAENTLIASIRKDVAQYGLGDTESLKDFIARLHAANPQ